MQGKKWNEACDGFVRTLVGIYKCTHSGVWGSADVCMSGRRRRLWCMLWMLHYKLGVRLKAEPLRFYQSSGAWVRGLPPPPQTSLRAECVLVFLSCPLPLGPTQHKEMVRVEVFTIQPLTDSQGHTCCLGFENQYKLLVGTAKNCIFPDEMLLSY